MKLLHPGGYIVCSERGLHLCKALLIIVVGFKQVQGCNAKAVETKVVVEKSIVL